MTSELIHISGCRDRPSSILQDQLASALFILERNPIQSSGDVGTTTDTSDVVRLGQS